MCVHIITDNNIYYIIHNIIIYLFIYFILQSELLIIINITKMYRCFIIINLMKKLMCGNLLNSLISFFKLDNSQLAHNYFQKVSNFQR